MWRGFWAALVLLFAAAPAAQARETGFLDRTIRYEGQDYAYQVYVPKDLRRGERLPLILFLHGAGERGDDGLIQTEVGIGGAIRRHPERWRAIVVMPQAKPNTFWQGKPAEAAMAALAAAEREFRTDPSRVYLTGLSMGGNGSWYLAYHHPERWAAMVVVCGFAGPRGPPVPAIAPAVNGDVYAPLAQKISKIPVWIIHGDADRVVSVEESRRMAAALKAAGADVTYRELPGVDHDSWVKGYAEEALPAWLFAKRKFGPR